MNKSILSLCSAWRLIHKNENWGVVWMNDSDLNNNYKWVSKGQYWQHKTDRNKKVRAV